MFGFSTSEAGAAHLHCWAPHHQILIQAGRGNGEDTHQVLAWSLTRVPGLKCIDETSTLMGSEKFGPSKLLDLHPLYTIKFYLLSYVNLGVAGCNSNIRIHP